MLKAFLSISPGQWTLFGTGHYLESIGSKSVLRQRRMLIGHYLAATSISRPVSRPWYQLQIVHVTW